MYSIRINITILRIYVEKKIKLFFMVEIARLELASTCIQNKDFALSYISVVDEIGIEPITSCFRDRRSAKLSYSSMNMVERMGLEPIRTPCKGASFPISLLPQIGMAGNDTSFFKETSHAME